jgi:hypothetical protein
MTRTSPSIFATQAVAAYEALRTAVLTGRSSGQRGLAILIHRGLAAWIAELKPQEPPATPSAPMLHPSTHSASSASTPRELTRVLAGIIVALTTGDAHAHS